MINKYYKHKFGLRKIYALHQVLRTRLSQKFVAVAGTLCQSYSRQITLLSTGHDGVICYY